MRFFTSFRMTNLQFEVKRHSLQAGERRLKNECRGDYYEAINNIGNS